MICASCDDHKKIEKALSKSVGIKVRIIPIHELLLDLLLAVKEDMYKRRKRYSNPATEFCRWFIRGYVAKKIDLLALDKELKK